MEADWSVDELASCFTPKIDKQSSILEDPVADTNLVISESPIAVI